MIEQVRRSMARHGLIAPGLPAWVAVSGGVDSMVLLHVLRRLGHPCHVLHVDHGLRGSESDADRSLVETYCHEQGILCRTVRVDMVQRRASTDESVQMAARELRYEAYRACVEEGPSVLAMAHHRDDAIETFFLHLLRGNGLHGWKGIPYRSGPFVRPLLEVDRSAIMAYAQEHGIPFREDASNRDAKYLRSRVRLEVLPLLDELRPGWRRVFGRDMALLRELGHAATAHLEQLLSVQHTSTEGTVQLPLSVVLNSASPQLALRTLLGDGSLHPERIMDLLHAMHEGHVGAQFPLADGRIVLVDRELLNIAPAPLIARSWSINSAEEVPVDAPLHFSSVPVEQVDLLQGPAVAWLDADALQFPLQLRTWRAGDRMRPIGLGGSKLISDVFIDAKVPRHEKARCLVLLSGDTIVWLCGHRVAEGFQARPDSVRVWRVALGEE